jgi:PKD domain
MRNWLKTFSCVVVFVLSACGGGGGSSVPPNTPPVANFAFSCTDLACTFTNLSSEQDAGDSLVGYIWNFGDASATDASKDVVHTYAAASTYTVTLIAIDTRGARGTLVRQVTVVAPPVPAAPHASFTAACVSLDCTFTDNSTYDAGSTFQSRVWNFGDTVTLAATNPATHTYALNPVTSYTVSLTVTDTAGKSSTRAQTLVVAPPATTLGCVSGNCALNLTQAARVTVTLVSHSCNAKNNAVVVTAPVTQTMFANGCVDTTGVAVPVAGGTLFPAGTALQLSVLSGTLSTSSIVFGPGLRIAGDFAQGWTLSFDDGYGGPAEPDFNDLVILVKATP